MPATDLELQHRVRIALSWRAEARRLEKEARERMAAGMLEAGRFRYLQQKFTDEAAAAQRALDALRQREGETAARLGAHLRECLSRKSAVAQQVKEGTVAHEVAAAEIGRLDEEIKALREGVAEFNRLLSMEDTASIGGHLHAALADYPVRLAGAEELLGRSRAAQPQRFSLNRRQLIMALLCSAIVLSGMGATWFIYRQNRTIEMVALWDADAPDTITVQCANHGAQDFVLYVPAPEDGAAMQPGSFSFHVQHTGAEGTESPMPTWGAWTVDARATQYSNPQRILAGKHASYVLHLNRLGKLEPGPHQFRIECANESGRVVNAKTVDAIVTATTPQ